MNTAPKPLDQILARNVRLALGPYNDDDRPITELIVQLRNKLIALAPPSGEGVGTLNVWRHVGGDDGECEYHFSGKIPPGAYVIVPANNATPQSAPVDEVVRYEPLSPTSNTMMRVVDAVSPDWAKRGEHPTDWINELGTLGQHPNSMPHWVRTAIKTIYHGLTTTPPPASQERGGVIEVDENEVRQELASLVSAAGTQKRFAELMGVSDSYVTDVLHGRRAVPGAWVIPSGYRMRWIKDAASPPSSAAADVTAGGTSTSDDELPGMWSPSDFTGGATGAAEQAKPDDPVFHRQSRLLHSIIPAEQAQAGESSCGPAASLSNETLVEVAGFASGLSHYRLNVGPDRGGVR